MAEIIQFHHPANRDEYTAHQVAAGTNLQQWLVTTLPNHKKLSCTLNDVIPLSDTNVFLGEDDIVFVSPEFGFGVDWLVYAAIAISLASAAYALTQIPPNVDAGDSKQPSSVYNYNAQGNKVRIGNPVKIQYGRMPDYPDIITPQWWEYDDQNHQIYYQVFTKGCGRFQFHKHVIGETPISEFESDIEVRTYEPGQTVDHFPHIVWTSKEVGGSDGQSGLTMEGVTGDWVASISNAKANFENKHVQLWEWYRYRANKDTTNAYWRKREWPWKKGQHIVITNTQQDSLRIEGNLSFIDKGSGGEPPEPLPDQIVSEKGWGELTVGERITITGAGKNSGTCVIAKLVDTKTIEVNNEAGEPITNLVPMNNVFCRIYKAEKNDGTYVCTDDHGSLQLVNAADLKPVPDWVGFVTMISETAKFSLLERDQVGPWVGNFITVPEGYVSQDIGLDFIFARGLGKMDNGSIVNRTVKWKIRWREAGTTNPYVEHEVELTKADNTPQRMTFWLKKSGKFVPGKRYEIGCQRVSFVDDNASVFDEVQWSGLKSVIQYNYVNSEETIITLKIIATNALSQQANSRYWNDSTRILPVRQANGQWIEQPTRSIAHAVIDACRNTVYGAGLPDDAIDFDTYNAYHAEWEKRGDYADGLFDSAIAFWPALKQLLSVGRSKPRVDHGAVSMWRDEPRVALCKPYAPVNMTDAFVANTSHHQPDDADGIEIEWFNPVTRKSERLLCTLPHQKGYRPKPIKLTFITDKAHAKREGLFLAASEFYRRTTISLTTDLDGWESMYGDLIPVAHDSVKWGEYGEVEDKWVKDGKYYLHLTGLMTWEPGKTHYIAFDLDGRTIHGPYRVESTDTPGVVILLDPPSHPIYGIGERGKRRSQYFFGTNKDTLYRTCIIDDVSMKGETQVKVKAIEDDPRMKQYA